MTSTDNLHVPQSKSNSALNSASVRSIMDAYNTQSKIQLYDDDSSQSQGAGNENIGVTGRDIPLDMLRPSSNPVSDVSVDENGNMVAVRRPSRGKILEEVKAYGDITNAYNSMRGVKPQDESSRPVNDLSSVKRFEASYVEDMPDTDEGLLEILELAINNARANLEMLESLYAALSPSQYSEEDGYDGIGSIEDDDIIEDAE